MMKKSFHVILAFAIACLVLLLGLPSGATPDGPGLDVYFFHSKTCPHCIKQKPLMNYIDEHNEAVRLHSFEVSESPDKWEEFLAERQINSGAVPRTFIGEKSFIGYAEENGPLEYNSVYQGYIGYRNQIVRAIEAEVGGSIQLPEDANPTENVSKSGGVSDQAQPGKAAWKFLVIPLLYLATYPAIKYQHKPETSQITRYWIGGLMATVLVSFFCFIAFTPETAIQQFARSLPFPLFVSAIAIADGFNPCAFTVLIILLSLLTHTKRRQDMTLIGSTFIITSAVMYFLFIMMMTLIGSVVIARYEQIFFWILGAILIGVGAINIKDYFTFNSKFSLSLSQEQKVAVTKRAGTIVRNLQAARSKRMFFAALGATVVLAIFVNLIELGCTAILPTVYLTSLVKYCGENVWLCYGFWTALYAIIYSIPLWAILFNFIYSFKSTRLTENQGRILKLVAGTLMLFFGGIMLVKPEFLNFG